MNTFIKSPLVGSWYSDNAELLKKDFESWRNTSEKFFGISGVNALIVPHAGYAYSGSIAATVYSSIDPTDYDTVLILAPSHRVALYEQVSVEPACVIETTLGKVEIDAEFSQKLLTLPAATYLENAHTTEHSVQIQLPFIQYFLGNVKIGALVVGHWDWNKKLADFAISLKSMLTPRTLLIVSTDFTHYGKNFDYIPFHENIEQNIFDLDNSVFKEFTSNSNARFEEILNKTKATVCGSSPMKILLAMLAENAEVFYLKYDTSGRILNDFNNSVSYLGAFIKNDWLAPLKKEVVNMSKEKKLSSNLSKSTEQMLLNLARQALTFSVTQKQYPSLTAESLIPDELKLLRGAFVTLHSKENLRGCIGEILPTRPLVQVILERTFDAALRDTRFSPVQPQELDYIHIEISVLSEPILVQSYNDIILGTHGIILQKNGHSAVFLPQVATEQNWDIATTLSHLSVKAGLPQNAWQADTEFFVFTAQVFGE